MAGKYCTEIIGCTKITRANQVDTCTTCDTSKYFLLQNGTCICQPNYQLKGQTCVEICGDGKLIYLPCDDGNLINGDGCSSTCQIENGYKCSDGSIDTKSKCVYRGLVKLQPVCVYKIEENMAQIVLTTVPFVPNIVKSSPTLTFNLSKNYTMTSYTFDGQNIVISIIFQQDIEGEKANIKIKYDSNYIVSPDSSLSLELKQCNGDRLYYTTYLSKNMKTIIYLNIKIISAIVLLLWFIGSYTHKMIGVETLHTFQFILLPHALATRYFPVVVYFKELCNTLNIYQTMVTNEGRLSTKEQGRLCYSADIVYNNSIVFSVQLGVLFIYFAFIIFANIKKNILKKEKKSKKNYQENKESIDKVNKFRKFLYDFLVFPSFIGFFLNVVFSLMIHSNITHTKTVSQGVQTLIITFSLVCAAAIFFDEWKYCFVEYKEKCKTNKEKYVPLYLTFFLCLCILSEASLLSLLPNPLYIMLAIFFLLTILLICYRPYHHWLHNTALIVNQIGVMLNLLWVISQEHLYLYRQQEEMVAIIIIIWMSVIILFAVLRIIYQICKKRSENLKKEKSINSKHEFQEYQKKMIHQIFQETIKGKNSYLVQSQLLNIKSQQRRQYEQRRMEHMQFLNYQAKYERDINKQDKNGKLSPSRKVPRLVDSDQSIE